MHCCKKTIFARSQNIVNSPGVVCAYVCSSVMNCSMTHLFLSELIKLQRLLCSRINGCCVTTGMIGVGDTHYYMRVSLLACTVWRGYRAGWDNIGGQDVTQWTEIKDTPSSACFFFLLWCLKMCCCAQPSCKLPAECRQWCIGVFKDNGADWGWIQSAQHRPNLNRGGAQRWQKPPILKGFFVSLQVIWVTSLPASLPSPLCSAEPNYCSLILTLL